MSLILTLVAGTVPFGTEFPGTVQGLLDMIAQYEGITGGENFIAINFGPNEPGVDDRGSPWFKTDNSGNPIGWYSWNGMEWAVMPVVIPSGTTGERPNTPATAQMYFDTDINVLLIFYGTQWSTIGGSPGDMKFVQATTIEDALTKNPGWIQADENTMSGRVLGAAGTGTGLTPRNYGDSIGEEDHTLILDEIPSHYHEVDVYVAANNRWTATGAVSSGTGNLAGYGGTGINTTPAPSPETGGLSHNTMQPTFFAWLLVKE